MRGGKKHTSNMVRHVDGWRSGEERKKGVLRVSLRRFNKRKRKERDAKKKGHEIDR